MRPEAGAGYFGAGRQNFSLCCELCFVSIVNTFVCVFDVSIEFPQQQNDIRWSDQRPDMIVSKLAPPFLYYKQQQGKPASLYPSCSRAPARTGCDDVCVCVCVCVCAAAFTNRKSTWRRTRIASVKFHCKLRYESEELACCVCLCLGSCFVT